MILPRTRIYDRGCLRITTSRKDSWAWWLFGTWCFTCPQCYVFGILIVPRVLIFDMHVTWEASTSAIVRTIPVPRSMNPKHQSVLDMTWMLNILHFLAQRRSRIEMTNKTMALATDQLNLWGLKLNVPKPKSTKSESNFNIVVFPFESVCWANLAIICVWKYLYLSSWVSGEFVEFWSFRKVNVAIILADLQPCIITGPRQRLDQRRAVTLFFVSSLTTVNPKHNNENKTEIQTNSKIMRLLLDWYMSQARTSKYWLFFLACGVPSLQEKITSQVLKKHVIFVFTYINDPPHPTPQG